MISITSNALISLFALRLKATARQLAYSFLVLIGLYIGIEFEQM